MQGMAPIQTIAEEHCTFMILADAFIHFFFLNQYVCSLGIEPTTFCTANAMLYHWATGTRGYLVELSVTHCVEAVVDEMLQVFAHSDLPHELVLVAVHPSQLTNMSEDVLQSIWQLQSR